MKGLVVSNKVLHVSQDLEVPKAKENEVLVNVKYSSIHSFDVENVEGKNDMLARLMGAKKHPVRTGIEFAGIVETDGVVFNKGDKVFGYPDLTKGQKAHQDVISINEKHIAVMPANLEFYESAAIPVGALTSLVALEELGKIKAGSKVLINGASGGLGVYAVQIARIFDAEVTAVAGPKQEEFLKGLGADSVINYKNQNIIDLDGKYDIVFDLTARVQFGAIKHLLSAGGIFVPANPFSQLGPILGNPFRKKKVGYLLVDKGDTEKLNRIKSWVEEEKIIPVIDEIFEFEDYEKGFKRTAESNKRGRIILKMEE